MTDAVLLPANRAQVVQNGLVDRVGTVRAQFEVANPFDIDQAVGYPIDGIEMFTGTDPRFDRLVTAAGGNIYQSLVHWRSYGLFALHSPISRSVLLQPAGVGRRGGSWCVHRR